SDEETGSDDSKYLSAAIAKEYDYCMVFEAAGVKEEIVVGRKGVGTFFVDIEGKAAHAGNHYSDGADANLEAAHKLIELVALTNLDKQTTVNVGKLKGGLGANTISPQAHLTFELRYTTTDERDRVLNAIDKIMAHSHVEGTSSTLSGGIQRDVMQPSPEQMAFVDKINTLCNISLPTEKRGGVSDANVISAQGVATLDGWGPYGDGDHTVNERASKKSFEERIELVSQILGHFLEGKI
ncbi:MAG TPA: M20/M25/M40 family metallo-hydrolase, partial [Sulfurovum sp.]|nr:M20/M25/M40 family metallo-hydrolase [Sulfurovum sp.]